jgi:hypothetical protein
MTRLVVLAGTGARAELLFVEISFLIYSHRMGIRSDWLEMFWRSRCNSRLISAIL